jgi:hypothetical protein
VARAGSELIWNPQTPSPRSLCRPFGGHWWLGLCERCISNPWSLHAPYLRRLRNPAAAEGSGAPSGASWQRRCAIDGGAPRHGVPAAVSGGQVGVQPVESAAGAQDGQICMPLRARRACARRACARCWQERRPTQKRDVGRDGRSSSQPLPLQKPLCYILNRAERDSSWTSGFIMGGVVFGTLGFLFAPQISRALLGDDQRIRLPRFMEEEGPKDPEATKQELIDKIAQVGGLTWFDSV